MPSAPGMVPTAGPSRYGVCRFATKTSLPLPPGADSRPRYFRVILTRGPFRAPLVLPKASLAAPFPLLWCSLDSVYSAFNAGFRAHPESPICSLKSRNVTTYSACKAPKTRPNWGFSRGVFTLRLIIYRGVKTQRQFPTLYTAEPLSCNPNSGRACY